MSLRMCAALLISLGSAAGSALAQYSNSDSRNPMYYEYQRQEREKQQEKDKENQQRNERQSAQDAENYRIFMENQRKLQERLSGEVERDRALFMKTPPVPPQKNGLLGQWRLDKTKKKPANAFAEINAAISQPACELVFGDGIWDFRPKALYGIDAGIGETMLTEVDYRGNEGLVGVIPKRGKLFVFKILGPDRVQELTSSRIGADPCNFVRVGAGAREATAPTASQAANPPTSGGPSAASGRALASPATSTLPASGAAPKSSTALQVAGTAGVVVDGAAFRCGDGSLLQVSLCQGNADDATCKLTELHLPGLQMGKPARRADIAARVNGCEAGGIRYGADDKPVFVR